MTFEGAQLQGSAKIAEKLQTLTFQKINRAITSVDSQPTFDGGVLISVLGRLQVSIGGGGEAFCDHFSGGHCRNKMRLFALLTEF